MIFVGITENEARQLLLQRIAVAFAGHHANQAIAGSGGAVQITAADLDPPCRFAQQACVGSGQVEFHPFRQELLNGEWHAAGGDFRRWVGAQFELPGAGCSVGWQLDGVPVVSGESLVGLPGRRPLCLAVRAAESCLNWLRWYRMAIGIACHHRNVEVLARPVEVAPAVGKQAYRHVGHAGDVEFGQVKRRLPECDQRHLFAPAGHHDPRTWRPLGKVDAAIAVTLAARQGLATAIDPAHFDAGAGLAVSQRADVGVGAATAILAQVQTQIADIEIGRLVVAPETIRSRHHCHVDAGFAQGRDALDRNEGHAAAIGLLFGKKAADEGAARQLVQLVKFPVADRAFQPGAAVVVAFAPVAFAVLPIVGFARGGRGAAASGDNLFEETRQLIRLDPEKLDVHFRHVDRGHRQATILCCRQDHAAAGEVEGRRNGSGAHREAGLLLELAAVPGHQTGLHADHIACLWLDPREEQQVRVVADHPGAADRLAIGERRVSSQAVTGSIGRRRSGLLLLTHPFVLIARSGGLRCQCVGWHFQDLDELVVACLAIEGQAERERQCRRAIKLAMSAVDHFEADASGGRCALILLWQMPDGEKAGDRQRCCCQHGERRRPPALLALSSDVHDLLRGGAAEILAGGSRRASGW